MNARQRGKDSGRSGPTRGRLFGAFEHVHNLFSTNSRNAHDVEAYRKDGNLITLGVVDSKAEMTRIEAGIMAQNLIAWLQKS